MSFMQLLFKTYRDLTEQDFAILWEKAIFVFDTNVLLDLYRLPENASNDLFKILSDDKLNNRLWIPFQVILEFLNNRTTTIGSQKTKFEEVRKIIKQKIDDIDDGYTKLADDLNKLQLRKRHSLINTDNCVNQDLFSEPVKKLQNFLAELDELDKKHLDVADKDEIQQRIFKIFEDKIGTSPSKEELEKIYSEGENRYKENIPPGYKDANKKEIYYFEDKKFISKFGDLLIWKEILKKVQNENLEYIVLVTGETKEDWWQEKRGKKLGARNELLNEIYSEVTAVKIFHIYDTSNFMRYANQYLQIDVRIESIEETKVLLKNDDNFENKRSKILWDTLSEYEKERAEVWITNPSLSLADNALISQSIHTNFSSIEHRILSVFETPYEKLTKEEIYKKADIIISSTTLKDILKTLVEKKALRKQFLNDPQLGQPLPVYFKSSDNSDD